MAPKSKPMMIRAVQQSSVVDEAAIVGKLGADYLVTMKKESWMG